MGLMWAKKKSPTWRCRAGLIDRYIHVNPISSDIPSITMVKHLLDPPRYKPSESWGSLSLPLQYFRVALQFSASFWALLSICGIPPRELDGFDDVQCF